MLTDAGHHRRFPSEPLAIVGIACRLPGADDLNEFWSLLTEGKSGITEVPPHQLDRELFVSPERGRRSKTYATISGLIPPRTDDPAADFRAPHATKLKWDPCHEILAGVVDTAIKDAGWSSKDLSATRTGTYVGHSSGSSLGGEVILGSVMPQVADTLAELPLFQQLPDAERSRLLESLVAGIQYQRPVRNEDGPHLDASYAAQYVAENLQLDGPQMVVDAACASSLIALALAGAALVQGEIDQAVVASASYYKTDSMILFSQAQSCSATGSRPFDSEADGLVNAEGYVAIIIKTLSRAIADGDPIRGVIRGIGLSSDGRGRSLWAPRKEGQLEAVRRAYADHIDHRSVQYVEAHATSTQVGDATELQALAAHFQLAPGDPKIPLGSVKSNIGHTLESAGLASLVKCVLSMKEGLVPPTINLESLNPTIDWDANPFRPVTKLVKWPDRQGQPRRAAVNAFGIGGLNAHVIVDGPVDSQLQPQNDTRVEKPTARRSSRTSESAEAIAIVGRGVIVPGAFELNSLRRLLRSGESQLISPPANRWSESPFSATRPAIHRAFPHAKGGYICGYEYDWRKHRIPPLQIELANPLQFMLLDAAQQALDESGFEKSGFDRARAAVIVGTLFGGEFSHQLQIGLRLHEILGELSSVLKQNGWNPRRIEDACRDAEDAIVKNCSAIRDQTGSFTCSTQASRIAKTLNVMGGAMAIDCGDCSGLAALQSSQQLLASRVSDFVFCAAAQRDLDAPAFEAWNFRKFESGAKNGQRPAPGEGVVVLLLRRLNDAIKNGDKVYGVIRDVRATTYHGPLSPIADRKAPRQVFATSSRAKMRCAESSTLTRQFGHLQGASALLDIVGLTIEVENEPEKLVDSVVRSMTEVCEFQALFESTNAAQMKSPQERISLLESQAEVPPPAKASSSNSTENLHPERSQIKGRNGLLETRKADTSMQTTELDADVRIARFWGYDEFELRQKLATSTWARDTISTTFPEKSECRLTIVASAEDWGRKVQLAIDHLEQKKSAIRVQEQGIFYRPVKPGETPRSAAMFPGQGSQNKGMLADIFGTSQGAKRRLEQVDLSLRRLGQPTFSSFLTGEEVRSESDLRSTQLTMLAADVSAYATAREWGLRPDFLIGHSFGEYAALVAADALDIESAIAITLSRAEAVAGCAHGVGAMLSIAAPQRDVAALMKSQSELFISHANSPRQTVVAGSFQRVTEFAAVVKAAGIAALSVPVGSPFHTPLLQAAQPELKAALKQHRWRPPQIPLLSSVSGRFVADRDVIIENLTRQLIQPIDWIELVERLYAEGVRVFVEVGPGRVLTKLTQQVLGEREVFVVPMDEPSTVPSERQLRIQAALETMGAQFHSNVALPVLPMRTTSSEHTYQNAATPVDVSDLTLASSTDVERESDAEQVLVKAESAVSDVADCLDQNREQSLADLLVDIVVEQTGYPREVIELDWDLEADLGIDSIRKAQILGELNEYFDLTSAREKYNFNDLRSIRDILNMLGQLPEKSTWLDASNVDATSDESLDGLSADSTAPVGDANETDPSRSERSENPSNSPRVFDRQFDDFLIDFVVERTGYPRDVIELDADLESDLGIDSIAKAQLIGEIRDHFHLAISEVSTRAALSEIRTLRQVRETFEAAAGEASSFETPPEPVTNGISNGHRATANGFPLDHPHGSNGASHSRSTWDRHETGDSPNGVNSVTEVDRNASDHRTAFDRGRKWGKRNKIELQNRLFEFADRASTLVEEPSEEAGRMELDLEEDAQLRGIADGAEVHPLNVFTLHRVSNWPALDDVQSDESEQLSELTASVTSELESPLDPALSDATDLDSPSLTQRFQLEMSPTETRKWSGARPVFAGGAIVIGNHSECAELVRRLESFQVSVAWLRELGTREQAVSALEKIWQETPSPHLFILSPRDPQAAPTLDEAAWKNRRETGITSLYWFCQKWFGLVEQAQLLDDACLFAATSLGGDFGVSEQIVSPESGAITGLLKSILIESWVNGARSMPIKILDLPRNVPPTNVVDALCVELTVPTYDVEIGWNGDQRSILRSIPARFGKRPSAGVIPTGNWIVTGGARGITAYLVKELATHFPEVHFHLVGTAPAPALTEEQRELANSNPDRLRAESMRKSKKANGSPLKAWQELEKAIEIDRTLREFQEMGISVTYHSCDVADRSQLSDVLQTIRRKSGAIRGVIHGAGIGKDASFPRKEAKMVERCLSAKLDGVLNLMALTHDDPLQGFIGFGSISGRFGANGHTDYSLANDMLAKLVGWHRQLRPNVPSAVFHWHAWDDIGMATKPETRLALEMIGLKLMPAREGAEHFIREIGAGLPLSEVLITDDRYYRMFYPADRMLALPADGALKSSNAHEWPLVRKCAVQSGSAVTSDATLHPIADPFLSEHRLRDRPLLPMVIMTELLAEGASLANDRRRVTGMRDLEIITSIKFPTDSPCDVQIVATAGGADSTAELRADFHSRNGKLVSASRLHAKAIVEFDSEHRKSAKVVLNRADFEDLTWNRAQYPAAGADFYVGGPLRCLRKLAIHHERKCVWGRIDAPSLGELAGVQRDVVNWLTPSAVLDAALFATGVLTWNCVRPGVCLPRKMKHIEFVRVARPAESCLIRTQFVETHDDYAVFDIVIWGSDDEPLLIIDKYVAAWLPS